MTSSEIKVFQSIGAFGSGFAQRLRAKLLSIAVCTRTASAAIIEFHSVSDSVLSHALTSAILVVGASKKFG
jgi:hypothetical protein